MDPNIKSQILSEYTQFNYIWIDDFQNARAGDISKVIDVQKQGDMTFLIFNNNNKVNLKTLNEFLQPTNDSVKDGGPPLPKAKQIPFSNKDIGKQPIDNGPISNVPMGKSTKVMPSVFSMFKHEKRDFKMTLNISIPDLGFLKMMHKNAGNKNDFIDSLSEYVLGEINKKAIESSLKAMISSPKRPVKPSPKKKPEKNVKN